MERSLTTTTATTTTGITTNNNTINNQPKHILFDLSPIDPDTDEIEEKTRRCYQNLKQMIKGKSPKERHETYAKYISANLPIHINELTMGLLVAILVEQEGQNDYYSDVVAFSKDNLNLFATHMNLIITERISKLSNHSVRQLFWITRQLIKANVAATDTTCSNLIRQTAKGDLSPRNLIMAENLIDLFCDTRSWLINSNTFIGPTIIFNTMRLIADHEGVAYKALRKKEVDFVISVIRERFEFVLQIGKDFLRLLHYLTRLPEFQTLSHDIYVNNPKSLSPKYEGPHQLLIQRTPRRLFQSCLTYEIERKIVFLATNVNFGNQRRYQDWFNKQFLSGTESTLLRCDLIRYICTIIHPSNEVLCSNIIPRWAIIGWLLTTSAHVISSCRLALFLDWLSYDQTTDNIMNIEPAILLMCHSVRSHPLVTANLLDFLCRAPTMFDPKISEQIKIGIKRSLQQILEKRVLQSLKPIFSCPKYDPSLRTMIKECFPEYGQIDNGVSGVNDANSTRVVPQSNVQPAPGIPAPVNHQTSQTNPKKVEIQQATIAPSSQLMPVDDEVIILQQSETTKAVPMDLEQNNLGECQRSRESSPELSQSEKIPHIKASIEPELDQQNEELVNTAQSKTSTPINQLKISIPSTNNENNTAVNPPESELDHCIDQPTKTVQHPEKLVLKDAKMEDLIFKHKVRHYFFEVKRPYPNNLDTLTPTLVQMLEDLRSNSNTNSESVSELIAEVDGIAEFDTPILEAIGDSLANSFKQDFGSRIFYGSDTSALKDSIESPFFNLCAEAFSGQDDDQVSRAMSILAYIGTIFKATGFLIIYYIRVQNLLGSAESAGNFLEFCNLRNPPDEAKMNQRWREDQLNTKSFFEEDLQMMFEYDPEMLAFVLPTIFSSDYASKFDVTNNDRIIRIAMSAMDPVSMNDLISYCMTGTTKVVSRDNSVQGLIKSSLEWPTWEQFCLWKIIAAQSVPLECYLPLLNEFSAKQHAEAVSSIILSLQKVHEPDAHMVESVINSFGQGKEHFIASVLRHWAMKTDVKELVKNVIALLSQPQLKRKGQSKSNQKPLSAIGYKTLGALEMIRLKAPKNKIFAQAELFESLMQVESHCDEMYKRKFARLFDMQPKQTKKKKLDKET